MNITIKQLQGGQCSIEVSPTTKIIDIKQHIATRLKIPIEEQKLLHLGRALGDNQTVDAYPSIKNGTKLNLVVKKTEGLLEAATKYFKENGMSELESKNAANQFIQILNDKLDRMSWDDLDRLAYNCLIDECGPVSEMDTGYESDNDDAIEL